MYIYIHTILILLQMAFLNSVGNKGCPVLSSFFFPVDLQVQQLIIYKLPCTNGTRSDSHSNGKTSLSFLVAFLYREPNTWKLGFSPPDCGRVLCAKGRWPATASRSPSSAISWRSGRCRCCSRSWRAPGRCRSRPCCSPMTTPLSYQGLDQVSEWSIEAQNGSSAGFGGSLKGHERRRRDCKAMQIVKFTVTEIWSVRFFYWFCFYSSLPLGLTFSWVYVFCQPRNRDNFWENF